MASIKTFDYNNYPVKQTIFEIIKSADREDIKKKIGKWGGINYFPSIFSNIKNVEPPKVNKTGDTQENYLLYFNAFNDENNLKNPAKKDLENKLPDLFKVNDRDSDLIKLLKQQAKEQDDLIKEQLKRWEAGVIGMVFLLDSIKDFYLRDLPADIQEELNQPEPVKLSDLDQEKLKELVDDIFASLYTDITSLEKQENLNNFFNNVNGNLSKLKTLINDARKTKKPEPEKPAEKPQDPQELTNLKNELNEVYAYIDGLLDRQSQRPIYILTEEPAELPRGLTTEKPNPNYKDFEEELTKHPLIKDKIQERINKRKFSTPIEISKPKPTSEQPTPPQPTSEQISKATAYDNLASIFPNSKIPDNFSQLWQSLNDRPNVSQQDYNNLLQQQGVKPEELKLLLKDNWEYLKGHIDILTNIIKRAMPTSKPDLSGGSSSTSDSSKPKSSESESEKPNTPF